MSDLGLATYWKASSWPISLARFGSKEAAAGAKQHFKLISGK
jgi:hypothetical protein